MVVVDDVTEIQDLLKLWLGEAGWAVSAVATGLEAQRLLRNRQVDLVITDVTMPAMDGLELLARIMADWPWIKVVLITGCADTDLKLQAQMLGAVAVLSKPCSLEQIQRTLRLALTK